MATTYNTIKTLLNTYVFPNYKTFSEGLIPESDYIDMDTLVIDPPTNADYIAVAIIQAFVYVRNPQVFDWNTNLSASELKNLVTDVDNRLAAMKTGIDTVKTPLAAYLAGLP